MSDELSKLRWIYHLQRSVGLTHEAALRVCSDQYWMDVRLEVRAFLDTLWPGASSNPPNLPGI